jgi:hypothetical protein
MAKHSAAPAITKGLLKLARQIGAAYAPAAVAVEPGENCQPGNCFENVPAIVQRHGGAVQHGWLLREQPTIFVEGTFHAVWRRPGGDLVDVTPRADQLTEILFLPDSRKVWEGEPVDPYRMQLHEQPCYCGSGMPFNLCHALAEG